MVLPDHGAPGLCKYFLFENRIYSIHFNISVKVLQYRFQQTKSIG